MQNGKIHFCGLLFCPYSKANTHIGPHLQSLFPQVMHTVFFSYRISFWNSVECLRLWEKTMWEKFCGLFRGSLQLNTKQISPSPNFSKHSVRLKERYCMEAWEYSFVLSPPWQFPAGDVAGEGLQSRACLCKGSLQHLFQVQLSSRAFFSAVNKER